MVTADPGFCLIRRHFAHRTWRHALVALSLLTAPVIGVTPAAAEVSVGISVPGISIGINQPFYPELVLVPGLPVYYAPRAQSNYFFYDGLFWVYQDDRWYASAWYDGPWELVDPYYVPLFVLRVPVQYYVRPPVYFHGWVVAAPPRWDIHWGPRWAQHRHGWDHWDYRAIPRPAPPPLYQRYYSGDRYPRPEHQRGLRDEYYRYQPRDASVRRHFEARPAYHTPPPVQIMPPTRNEAPRAQYPQRDRDDERRPVAQPAPQARESIAQEQRPQPQDPGRRMPTAAPFYVQPQAVPRPREDVPRAPQVQAAPPQHRDHRSPEPRQSARPEVPRDAATPAAPQREPQGRDGDHHRGNAERSHGPERGR